MSSFISSMAGIAAARTPCPNFFRTPLLLSAPCIGLGQYPTLRDRRHRQRSAVRGYWILTLLNSVGRPQRDESGQIRLPAGLYFLSPPIRPRFKLHQLPTELPGDLRLPNHPRNPVPPMSREVPDSTAAGRAVSPCLTPPHIH